MLKTIKVTAEDIQNGNVGDCKECPIALACKRTFNTNYVLVDGVSLHVDIHSSGLYKYVRLPYSVGIFVDRFDKYGDGEPFSFEIDI